MIRISILAALLMILLYSCEEGYFTDCRECQAEIPVDVTLQIHAMDGDYVPSSPLITLYEGAVEDSVILMRYYIEGRPFYIHYEAVLYKDYTATLEFTIDGQKYVTVDAACPQLRYDETSCDEACYYVYDNILDLRLRYQ